MEKQRAQPEMSLADRREREAIIGISNGPGNRERILQNGMIIDVKTHQYLCLAL